MKRLLVVIMVLGFCRMRGVAEESRFSSSLSPQDKAETGLNALTPAQLARLDQLVEVYRKGEISAAQKAAADALAASQAAEEHAKKADAEVAAAKTEAAKAAETAKESRMHHFLEKARGVFADDSDANADAVETSIVGTFRGWERGRVFLLANGQRWQVVNNDSYFTPPRPGPKVRLVPASFGGCWMQFPELNMQVRVQLFGDK